MGSKENGKIINENPKKDELKGLQVESYYRDRKLYTEEVMLNHLKQFYEENDRIPVENDFNSNPKYPSYGTYINYFGS